MVLQISEENFFCSGLFFLNITHSNHICLIFFNLGYKKFQEISIYPIISIYKCNYIWNKIYKKDMLLNCYKRINTNINIGEDVAVVYPYLLQTNKIVICEFWIILESSTPISTSISLIWFAISTLSIAITR